MSTVPPSSLAGASDVASMFTTDGLMRSAMSAKLTSVIAAVRPLAAAGSRLVLESAGAGVSDPATMRPTRNEPEATSNTVTSANRRLMTAL